jgi:hypothetical protein
MPSEVRGSPNLEGDEVDTRIRICLALHQFCSKTITGYLKPALS